MRLFRDEIKPSKQDQTYLFASDVNKFGLSVCVPCASPKFRTKVLTFDRYVVYNRAMYLCITVTFAVKLRLIV